MFNFLKNKFHLFRSRQKATGTTGEIPKHEATLENRVQETKGTDDIQETKGTDDIQETKGTDDNIIEDDDASVVNPLFVCPLYSFLPSGVSRPESQQEIKYLKLNHIKAAMENNDPLEDNLHVIAVISNPCNYAKRVRLMQEFIQRMNLESRVILYIVELVYGDQPFSIVDTNHPRHLGLRTETPLWHKENMVNLGIYYLLPKDWKAVAWIDADIEFENSNWAVDTLRILNGCCDVVQLFSHAVDMNPSETTMNIFSSFGFQYTKGLPYSLTKTIDYWHPGYAWACTKKAYNKMGKLFDVNILGSGDYIMAHCFLGQASHIVNRKFSSSMNQHIVDFEARVKRLRLGYVPGVIRHHFHGSKINRKYIQRNDIIYKYHYNPSIQIAYDSLGVIVPTKYFQPSFKTDILLYFSQRNEDE